MFDALLAGYGFFLTIPDLMKITGLSRSTIDRMKRCGQIPLAKMNGSYKMRIDHFIGWWDRRVKAEETAFAVNLI
ncbi:MAG: AlpA family phage regulatory protein [Clostridia bacterium]|nr:AlpA family phage regulatory protein [Clostridia bacterium]